MDIHYIENLLLVPAKKSIIYFLSNSSHDEILDVREVSLFHLILFLKGNKLREVQDWIELWKNLKRFFAEEF